MLTYAAQASVYPVDSGDLGGGVAAGAGAARAAGFVAPPAADDSGAARLSEPQFKEAVIAEAQTYFETVLLACAARKDLWYDWDIVVPPIAAELDAEARTDAVKDVRDRLESIRTPSPGPSANVFVPVTITRDEWLAGEPDVGFDGTGDSFELADRGLNPEFAVNLGEPYCEGADVIAVLATRLVAPARDASGSGAGAGASTAPPAGTSKLFESKGPRPAWAKYTLSAPSSLFDGRLEMVVVCSGQVMGVPTGPTASESGS